MAFNYGNPARGDYLQPGYQAGLSAYQDQVAAKNASQRADGERSMRNHRRLVLLGKVATLVGGGAAFAPGGAAMGAAAAGGATTGATTGLGYSSPGVYGGLFGGAGGAASSMAPAAASGGFGAGLGAVLNSSAVGAGVNALSAYGAQRANSKATDLARTDTLKAHAESLALERQRLEVEARNADLDREEAKAVNAAINELKKRELDALEEARQFERTQYEAGETRRAPYRAAGQQALQRLSAIWGMG